MTNRKQFFEMVSSFAIFNHKSIIYIQIQSRNISFGEGWKRGRGRKEGERMGRDNNYDPIRRAWVNGISSCNISTVCTLIGLSFYGTGMGCCCCFYWTSRYPIVNDKKIYIVHKHKVSIGYSKYYSVYTT